MHLNESESDLLLTALDNTRIDFECALHRYQVIGDADKEKAVQGVLASINGLITKLLDQEPGKYVTLALTVDENASLCMICLDKLAQEKLNWKTQARAEQFNRVCLVLVGKIGREYVKEKHKEENRKATSQADSFTIGDT